MLDGLDPDVAAGHYAKKQLLAASRLIAWSHRRRLETGLGLVRRLGPRRVLDYGCGDGTFLALLMRGPGAPAVAVGAEISAALVEDCRRRLGRQPGLRFLHTDEVMGPEHQGAYDLVVCMEVLEHVVDLPAIVERLVGLVAPDGRLLVSVPVETGPAVLIKQSARRLAGWLGIGDYPGTTPYCWSELLRALRGGEHQRVARPVFETPDGQRFHDHKGFNWRLVRRAIAQRLRLEEQHTSPLPGLPPGLASQVWLLARKR